MSSDEVPSLMYIPKTLARLSFIKNRGPSDVKDEPTTQLTNRDVEAVAF